MSHNEYIGEELELFARAKNWKCYWASLCAPYLGDEVLEVGAGIGGTTRVLCTRPHRRWVCLEPDQRLAAQLEAAQGRGDVPVACQVKVGTLADLPADERFDSILYIDVVEHIAADAAELRLAAEHLKEGGVMIVLSPAHQWLYTAFDKTIGHYRRYSRTTLAAAMPPGLERVRLIYLDAVGMLASMGNRFLLRSGQPTHQQIQLWDRVMVRASRWVDPLLGRRVGKSVLGIYRRPAGGQDAGGPR
jgi:2-polyprenyl-3-methyl-5-hydroxy-6-metoxy-1,4-benzoquinol methylase